MADDKSTKLPAYLGGYDPANKKTLGYFPAFFPGQLDALSNQMAQGYGAATMQPTWGGPINAANGLPMAGVPANPALGRFGAAVPRQVLTGPTAAVYRAELNKLYKPMGSAIPRPVSPVTPIVPVTPVVPPKTGGGSGGKTTAQKRREAEVKRVNAENARDVAQGRSPGLWRVHNGRVRYEGWNR